MPHPVGRRASCWRNAVPCRTRVAAESTALLHSPWRCRGCLCALSDAWMTSSMRHLQGACRCWMGGCRLLWSALVIAHSIPGWLGYQHSGFVANTAICHHQCLHVNMLTLMVGCLARSDPRGGAGARPAAGIAGAHRGCPLPCVPIPASRSLTAGTCVTPPPSTSESLGARGPEHPRTCCARRW